MAKSKIGILHQSRDFSRLTVAQSGEAANGNPSGTMNKKTENTILQHALFYHRLGWAIIPIPYKSKKARILWGNYQPIRPDEAQVRKWFGNGKRRNIAVVLGEVSGGLACRDFDTMQEYTFWAEQHPELARTLPTVQTARGMHVYFEGHIERTKKIRNGELRSNRGYCLLPPSVHPDGVVYQWKIPSQKENLHCLAPQKAGFIPFHTEKPEQPEIDRVNRGIQKQTEHIEAIECGGVEKAIRETLPKEYGTRNRQVFEFTRALKSLPLYSEVDPRQLRDIVKQWHVAALPNIRTQEFEETWIDFLKAWPGIKYPKGKEPMSMLFQNAMQIEPPKEAVKLYPENQVIQTLATVCRELQREAGSNPFFLAARTAARYLEIDKNTANRYLFLLVQDEFLQLVSKGGTAEAPRKASRYRYQIND